MAERRPIVVTSTGDLEELPTTDTLPDVSPDKFSVTSGEAFAARDVLYQKTADGKWYKANAAAIATMPAVVFAMEAATGVDEAKDAQESGVLAGFTGLSQGTQYYVSDSVAGGITTSIPTGTGKVVQRMCRAISATEVLIDKGPVIVRA